MIFRFILALILFLNSLLLPADCSFVLASDGVPAFASGFLGDNDERYWLDGAGNWEDKITREASGAGTLGYIAAERHFIINDMNEYSQEAKQVYDSNGNPLPAQNIAITHDPNGNRWLRNPGERLRYDYLNRLVEITEVGSGQLKALYYYDAQNLTCAKMSSCWDFDKIWFRFGLLFENRVIVKK